MHSLHAGKRQRAQSLMMIPLAYLSTMVISSLYYIHSIISRQILYDFIRTIPIVKECMYTPYTIFDAALQLLCHLCHAVLWKF